MEIIVLGQLILRMHASANRLWKCLLSEAFCGLVKKWELRSYLSQIVRPNCKNTLTLTNELFIKVSAVRHSCLELFLPLGKVVCIDMRQQVTCEMFVVCCSTIRSLVAKNYLQPCLRFIVPSNGKITLFLIESFYNTPLTSSSFSFRTSFVYRHALASRLEHDYSLVATGSLAKLKWCGTNRSL